MPIRNLGRIFASLPAAGLALAVSLSPVQASMHGDGKDIVATATSAGEFTTLVTAIKAAGLVETLQGTGPFTVFAPTDAAFAKLPAGTVESLLKPENKAQLVEVLTYHVVPGKITSADLSGKTVEAKTVEGGMLEVDATDGVTVNDATVTGADVLASNGVIHVIDTVLIPE